MQGSTGQQSSGNETDIVGGPNATVGPSIPTGDSGAEAMGLGFCAGFIALASVVVAAFL